MSSCKQRFFPICEARQRKKELKMRRREICLRNLNKGKQTPIVESDFHIDLTNEVQNNKKKKEDEMTKLLNIINETDFHKDVDFIHDLKSSSLIEIIEKYSLQHERADLKNKDRLTEIILNNWDIIGGRLKTDLLLQLSNSHIITF